jgi:hypothetical protein
MTSSAGLLSRPEILRRELAAALESPAPANHDDHQSRGRNYEAEKQQASRVLVLQALFGRDRVAAEYMKWLDERLSEQVKTAQPLRSWDEVTISAAPVGWERDIHGSLCGCCGECLWQVIEVGSPLDRLCSRCANRELGWKPQQLWAPRLPPAHSTIQTPGGRQAETVAVTLSDGTTRTYYSGDRHGFVLGAWEGEVTSMFSGPVERPHLEMTGALRKSGQEFSFIAVMDYDSRPGGFDGEPYGFRFTSGTLTGGDSVHAFSGVFDMLGAIAG